MLRESTTATCTEALTPHGCILNSCIFQLTPEGYLLFRVRRAFNFKSPHSRAFGATVGAFSIDEEERKNRKLKSTLSAAHICKCLAEGKDI